MCEDDGLIYDYELDWKPVISIKPSESKIYYENDKLKGLYRIIDMKNSMIKFSDINRTEKIVDVNKVLVGESDSDELKKLYLPIINMVLDQMKPVTVPYKPERYTAFIESFPGVDHERDDILGILYFWDKPKERQVCDNAQEETLQDEMTPCKRFFHILPVVVDGIKFEEIDYLTYSQLKEEWMERSAKDVDNGSAKNKADKHKSDNDNDH